MGEKMELKELTEKFLDIFGSLEDFKIDSLSNSNCEKLMETWKQIIYKKYGNFIWQIEKIKNKILLPRA